MIETIGWRLARDMTPEQRTAQLKKRLTQKWNTRVAEPTRPIKAPQLLDEIAKINSFLPAHLHLSGDTSPDYLWAAIFSLHVNYVEGPKPHATWKDAALAEKLKNLRKTP